MHVTFDSSPSNCKRQASRACAHGGPQCSCSRHATLMYWHGMGAVSTRPAVRVRPPGPGRPPTSAPLHHCSSTFASSWWYRVPLRRSLHSNWNDPRSQSPWKYWVRSFLRIWITLFSNDSSEERTSCLTNRPDARPRPATASIRNINSYLRYLQDC